jgi:multidrug resistance efflux pump
METDKLTPIPTPMTQRWRDFRIQILPLVVFVVVVVAVIGLWWQMGGSGHLAGVAEGVRSTVTSPQAGLLQEVNVQPYQIVQQGDAIAVVQTRDPQVALDLLQSQLAISRLRLQPSLAEQNAMNFEQVRVDLLRTKSELAVAKVNLARLENEVRRNEPLRREKLVSEDIYDLSLKTRDMFKAEIETKTQAIAEIEQRMQELRGIGVPGSPSSNDLAQATLAQLDSMQASASSNFGPIVLRAPISGMVNTIYRQRGESVVEGEPLIAINSHWADRIVGFLRQPYPLDPAVGMSVHVTTRERKPRKFWSEVTQVGTHVEVITNSLAFIRQGSLVDAGLPVVVDIPRGLQVRPGEAVDITFRGKQKEAVTVMATTPVQMPTAGKPAGSMSVE